MDRRLSYSRREERMRMKTTRKRYSAEFKAKVPLEAGGVARSALITSYRATVKIC